MSSFVLGGGIWSMHFVAMLAHRFPVPVYYDLLQTLSSVLVAILVVGVALLLLHFTVRTPLILLTAGVILGVGILSMHYIGMVGIRGVEPVFADGPVLLSVIVAAVMGVAAIVVAYGRRSKPNIVAGSLLMGFSVVAVHYTAMHGTRFVRTSDFAPESAVFASGTLAVVVTLASFAICGSFLLATTSFLTSSPVKSANQGHAGKSQSGNSENSQDNLAPDERVSVADLTTSAGESQKSKEHPLSSADSETATDDSKVDENEIPAIEIPYEQSKKISFALSKEVAAIRADGHYTHLYTSEGVRFCPWSITEAEQRLVSSGFHRTHRSYLVNIESVVRFEKSGETGKCLFDSIPQLSSVPVSRNRIKVLADVLEPHAG